MLFTGVLHKMHICKLCQGSKVKHKYTLGNLTVGQCQDCGLTFVTTDIKENDLIEMYSSRDAQEWSSIGDKRHLIKIDKRLSEIAQLYNGQVKGLELLDVGCGGGEFCYRASRRGIKSVGIDISSYAIDFARKRHGEYAEYYNIDIKDMARKKGKTFDLVTLWDVIEHCKDPHKLISYCKSLVKKGGFICIETPNGDSMLDTIAHVAYLLNPKIGIRVARYSRTHLQIWTSSTLSRLMSCYGLKVVMVKLARELRYAPSLSFKSMCANTLLAPLMRRIYLIDPIVEKTWPIRNKLLLYAECTN